MWSGWRPNWKSKLAAGQQSQLYIGTLTLDPAFTDSFCLRSNGIHSSKLLRFDIWVFVDVSNFHCLETNITLALSGKDFVGQVSFGSLSFGYQIFQPLQPPDKCFLIPNKMFTPQSRDNFVYSQAIFYILDMFNITNAHQFNLCKNRQKQQTNNVQFSTNKQKTIIVNQSVARYLYICFNFWRGGWNWVVLGAAGTSFWVAGFNLSLATQANPTPVQIRIFRFYLLLKFNCFTTYEAEMTNH